MLRAHQERKSKTLAKVGRMVAKGDQQVLSKDVLITREHAEQELLAKGPAKLQNGQGNRQQ